MHDHKRNNIMNQRIRTNDNMMQGGRDANVPQNPTPQDIQDRNKQLLGGRSTPPGMTYGDFYMSQYLRHLFRRDMTTNQKYSLYGGLLLLFIFLAYMIYLYVKKNGYFPPSQQSISTKYEYF